MIKNQQSKNGTGTGLILETLLPEYPPNVSGFRLVERYLGLKTFQFLDSILYVAITNGFKKNALRETFMSARSNKKHHGH